MREILFRGKSIASCKWVTGYYYYDGLNYNIICDDGISHKVFPKTIGQYTGLIDKNGNKIFEGDIVSVYDWTSSYSSKYIGEVVTFRCSWRVESSDKWMSIVRRPLCFDDFADRKTEILGNIHDNQELLKGGAE